MPLKSALPQSTTEFAFPAFKPDFLQSKTVEERMVGELQEI